jgi:hypothetical protein
MADGLLIARRRRVVTRWFGRPLGPMVLDVELNRAAVTYLAAGGTAT